VLNGRRIGKLEERDAKEDGGSVRVNWRWACFIVERFAGE